MAKDLWFQPFEADVYLLDRKTMFLCRRKQEKTYIGINHHYDTVTRQNLLKRTFLALSTRIGFRKVDTLIAVSEYWQERFIELGARDVRVIYNAFTIHDVSDEEVLDVKRRYGLEGDRPLIYIGMNTREKGAVEVYERLKGQNYVLITSGLRKTNINTVHLDLPYNDYLCMLAASDLAINMSKIPEGWCRTAHEAMLMRTPVIGSGIAGMAELLGGGGQIICRDLADLDRLVADLLADPASRCRMAEEGYAFARQFSVERFNNDWTKLIQSILANTGAANSPPIANL